MSHCQKYKAVLAHCSQPHGRAPPCTETGNAYAIDNTFDLAFPMLPSDTSALDALLMRCAEAAIDSVMKRFVSVVQTGRDPMLIDLAHSAAERAAILRGLKP